MNRKQRRAQKHIPLSEGDAFAQAVRLHQSGRLAEAVKAYGRVASDNAQALSYKGAALFDLGKAKEAVLAYEQAIAITPDYADAHYNLGLALKQLGRLDQAVAAYGTALALKPDMVKAYSNLANVLRDQGELQRAVDLCGQAIALEPDYAEAYANLGNALLDLGRIQDAVQAYVRATALKPELTEAHWGEAYGRLLLGDFAAGWPKHEVRWYKSGAKPHAFPQPQWDGQDLNGKSILLHSEQGLGDTIQFVRYASMVKERGAGQVIVFCPEALARLLGTVDGVDQVISDPRKLPPVQVQCPLMSLPLAFKTDLSSIPAKVPYLKADADKTLFWRDKLGAGLNVGIVWQGNPKAAADKGRSPPLSCFADLMDMPGVQMISLQKDFGAEQLAQWPQVKSLGKNFDAGPDAFLDTAAVMMHLDLVVTSDTSLAHLAGALGRPVWVVLQANADWRWMLDRGDSPWYPTMRLFRQKVQGDWSEPFARIKSQISELV